MARRSANASAPDLRWNTQRPETRSGASKTVALLLFGPGSDCGCQNSDAALKEVDLAQYKIGNWWHRIRPGEAAVDRFNLIQPRPNGPSPTLTATADVGAAAVCHPLEPRKFKIAELPRLASFPDDFILTGNYRQQAERIGRAVPPVMMSHIAGAIRDHLR